MQLCVLDARQQSLCNSLISTLADVVKKPPPLPPLGSEGGREKAERKRKCQQRRRRRSRRINRTNIGDEKNFFAGGEVLALDLNLFELLLQ